jgi:nucleoside diphosphate kinase
LSPAGTFTFRSLSKAGTATDTSLSNSYKLVAIKLVTPPKEQLEKHYADLADKPFFPGLLSCASTSNYIKSFSVSG